MPHTLDSDRGFGYIPDVPSKEDLVYGSVGVDTLDLVDLRPKFKNEVEDQLRTSSCTANACVSALEFLSAQKFEDNTYPELSRLFAYYEARKVHNLHTVDAGSSIRACVDKLREIGICESAVFPFDPNQILAKPPAYCYQEAPNHRVLLAKRIDGLSAMMECLTAGFPFVFGFQTYSGSMSIARQTGRMPMPTGQRSGGHAVLAVGYNKATRHFIIRNSYGSWWGADGYFEMPFEYVTRSDLSADWWAMKAVDWKIDV